MSWILADVVTMCSWAIIRWLRHEGSHARLSGLGTRRHNLTPSSCLSIFPEPKERRPPPPNPKQLSIRIWMARLRPACSSSYSCNIRCSLCCSCNGTCCAWLSIHGFPLVLGVLGVAAAAATSVTPAAHYCCSGALLLRLLYLAEHTWLFKWCLVHPLQLQLLPASCSR
jgi:hypothetical protein